MKFNISAVWFFVLLIAKSHEFGSGFFGASSNSISNPAIRLLESQLQIAAKEQQQIGSRLIRAGLQETVAEASKLKFIQAVQTTFSNTLASKGLFDLNNIGQSILSYNIRNCYQNNKFSFSDAINMAKAQVSQCLSDKLSQAQSIIENGRSNIENALNNIMDVGQILSECAKITSAFPSAAGIAAKGACLNKAILAIRTDTVLLPINIAKRIIEVKESIATIQTDMGKCGLNVIEAIYEQSTYAGQAIINCINESNGITTTTLSSTTA